MCETYEANDQPNAIEQANGPERHTVGLLAPHIGGSGGFQGCGCQISKSSYLLTKVFSNKQEASRSIIFLVDFIFQEQKAKSPT